MKYVDTNLNNYIKVKLTRYGEYIMDSLENKYNKMIEDFNLKPYTWRNMIDEEGYIEFQMWEFINIFGGHFNFTNKEPVAMNIKIQANK